MLTVRDSSPPPLAELQTEAVDSEASTALGDATKGPPEQLLGTLLSSNSAEKHSQCFKDRSKSSFNIIFTDKDLKLNQLLPTHFYKSTGAPKYILGDK